MQVARLPTNRLQQQARLRFVEVECRAQIATSQEPRKTVQLKSGLEPLGVLTVTAVAMLYQHRPDAGFEKVRLLSRWFRGLTRDGN